MFVNKSKKNYSDLWMTPPELAKSIVDHFSPTGVCLEPARGEGAFYDAFPGARDWCEITDGRDFLTHTNEVDWIITNPPWSIMRKFLKKSYELADNIVFLMPVYHIWTSARHRDMVKAGFGVKEICLVEPPINFPVMGFVLAAIHLQKNHDGPIKLTNL